MGLGLGVLSSKPAILRLYLLSYLFLYNKEGSGVSLLVFCGHFPPEVLAAETTAGSSSGNKAAPRGQEVVLLELTVEENNGFVLFGRGLMVCR